MTRLGPQHRQPAGLRRLPAVDTILNTATGNAAIVQYGRGATTDAVRAALDQHRHAVKAGAVVFDAEALAGEAAAILARQSQPRVRPVFNLTGVVLHTNLGRAQLAEAAIAAATAAMRQAVALEFDLNDGGRGERDDLIREALIALTGAEDATVVNNNAAAVMLTLNTLGKGREVIVSRGELIEIGGSFRLPALMARAGVRLVEVGTTNRTHAADYADAITARSALVLKVHTSNYRIEGFTAAVADAELVALGRAHGVVFVNDLGSGTLVDLTRFGLGHEPTVREAVAAGADLVTFSGDKLLGGPQAGFIVGRKHLIAALNKNPMKRAMRVDKIRLAAIEATLALYRDPDRLAARLPTLRFLARTHDDIATSAARLLSHLTALLGADWHVEAVSCASEIGSGALPRATIASAGLAIAPAAARKGRRLAVLAAAMRALPMPVIGRISKNALILDLRCLDDEEAFMRALGPLPDLIAAGEQTS